MLSFARNEIVSATKFVREFSSYMKSLSARKIEKIGMLRNNEMQAVIVPIDDYERLTDIAEKFEHAEIAGVVEKRKSAKTGNYVDLDDVLEQAGL